jgi:hypothetical protein
LAFLTQNKAKLCKILIITLVLKKNANFFAENCDHNIGPRSPWTGLSEQMKSQSEVGSATNLLQKWIGCHIRGKKRKNYQQCVPGIFKSFYFDNLKAAILLIKCFNTPCLKGFFEIRLRAKTCDFFVSKKI